jgi:hypothetical protein
MTLRKIPMAKRPIEKFAKAVAQCSPEVQYIPILSISKMNLLKILLHRLPPTASA